MQTNMLWLFEGIMVTKKDREYHTLSMNDILSARWEYDAENMILSAHADTLCVRLIVQHWEYDALSATRWRWCAC